MITNEQELNGALNNEVVETGDYNKLQNKPLINNVELFGNKTLDDLGIASKEDIPTVPENVSYFTNDAGYITAIPEDYAKKEYVDGKIGDIETVLSTLTTITEEV